MFSEEAYVDSMAHLRARMQALLDELAGQGRPVEPYEGQWAPPADIAVEGDSIVVTVEVPGVQRENLDVTVQGQTLTVEGRRPAETDEEAKFVQVERPRGRFRRSFALPWKLDPGSVQARLERGVLTVTVRRGGVTTIPVEEAE